MTERDVPRGDIAAFGELIDDYQCAQIDGTHADRAAARIALMNAYRAALASSDAQADGGKDSSDNGPTVEQSTRYAKQLAVSLWSKHFDSSAPSWRPLDDLYGLLSQIDNMTVDLVCADSGNGEVHAALMRSADMVQALPKHFMIGDCAEKIRQMADAFAAPQAECAPRDAITDADVRRLNSDALQEMHKRGLVSFTIEWWPAFTRYIIENAAR